MRGTGYFKPISVNSPVKEYQFCLYVRAKYFNVSYEGHVFNAL